MMVMAGETTADTSKMAGGYQARRMIECIMPITVT